MITDSFIIDIATPNGEQIIPLMKSDIVEMFGEPTTFMELKFKLTKRYSEHGTFNVPFSRGLVFDLMRVGAICEASMLLQKMNDGRTFKLYSYMEVGLFHEEREDIRAERIREEQSKLHGVMPMRVKVKVK